MVNNPAISVLARLLDFSLHSLACLARERGFTNPSWTEFSGQDSYVTPNPQWWPLLKTIHTASAQWANGFSVAEREQMQHSVVG